VTEHGALLMSLAPTLSPPVVPVPERNFVGPRHFSFTCTSVQLLVTQPPPVASESSYSECPSLIVIPDMPGCRTRTLAREGWRIVVQHWLEGDPQLKLYIPLKDWLYKYMHRSNHKWQSKYNQQRTIATKFLEW